MTPSPSLILAKVLLVAGLLVATLPGSTMSLSTIDDLALAGSGQQGSETPPTQGQGRSTDHTYTSGAVSGTYRMYTPASYSRKSTEHRTGVPLLVVIHGCATTAAEQEGANRQNRIADRTGMVILYPNTGTLGQAQCWDWYTAGRDAGDGALIAGMVEQVKSKRRIDPDRVYVIGMSSGGMLTSVLVASYPDVFAAGGLMAGIAYKDLGCPFTGVTLGADTLSQQAVDAMAERARVVPMIILRGTEDASIPQACGDTAAQQWVLTNQTNGNPLRAAVRSVTRDDRYPSQVTTFKDASGCLAVERWEIQGMAHYWSGGTDDADYATWTDPRGPDAGVISWRFFSRYRLTNAGSSCRD